MHSLASSYTYMHYINALHRGDPTKTCPQSGIGAVTLKSFKKLERLSKASKSFSQKVLSIIRYRDLRSFKSFKKTFTPRKLYEMTNHLLQQVESQCLSECRKTFIRQMDPRPIYFGFWCLMTNTTKLD